MSNNVREFSSGQRFRFQRETMIVSPPHHPSLCLRYLCRFVRKGYVKRGYGWMLRNVPAAVWGGENIIVDTPVGDMVVPISDPGCASMLLFNCVPHEVQESELVRKLSGGCQVMLDIGAHVGWYSLLMQNGMSAEGQVFAFEPNPRIYPYLAHNVSRKAGVSVYRIALSDKEREIPFYCSWSSNLSSAVRDVGPRVAVKSMSLDDFCRSRGIIKSVDFVKCDVEGGELNVLRGARGLRSTNNAPIWMLEIDKVFLEQAGTSTEEIMKEIFHQDFGSNRLYYLNSIGKYLEIQDISENISNSNVFIVPEARICQFKKATK